MIQSRNKTRFPEEYYSWTGRWVTSNDLGRVMHALKDDIGNGNVDPAWLHQLYLLVSNSKKMDAAKFPGDIVTLRSRVLLQTGENKKMLVRIVFPQDMKEEIDISVYSPLGRACLGAREKSYICFTEEGSEKRYFIDQIVFQPEREKLYHL